MRATSRRPRSSTPADLLVVGLGNPGDGYAATRHNAGRWAIDELLTRHGAKLRRSRREHALTAELRIDGRRVAVAAPTGFMNESGRCVAPLMRRHDIEDPGRLVVIHDELDIPVGRLKVKSGGGLAGHNGLKSIRSHLHSADFTRIRIGIGRPDNPAGSLDATGDIPERSNRAGGGNQVKYVLAKPGKAERAELQRVVLLAADAVESLAQRGLEATMNLYNTKS